MSLSLMKYIMLVPRHLGILEGYVVIIKPDCPSSSMSFKEEQAGKTAATYGSTNVHYEDQYTGHFVVQGDL